MSVVKFTLASAVLALVSTSLSAQAVPESTAAPVIAVERQKTVTAGSVLPENTEVLLRLDQELNSKAMATGQRFKLSVAHDVMVGDYIVIPRGVTAYGQIGYRTGKGAFGKSAKMEFDLVGIQLGDHYLPMTGHYRIEGQGNTGAAVGAVVAVGVFGAFVTGHSAVAAQGSEWKAFTKEAVPIVLAPAPATVPTPAPVAAAAPVAAVVPASLTVAK